MPLREEMAAAGERITAHFRAGGEPPFILYQYDPNDEWTVRREMGELRRWLEAPPRSISCAPVSLADLFWRAVEESGYLDELVERERSAVETADGSAMREVHEAVGETVFSYIERDTGQEHWIGVVEQPDDLAADLDAETQQASPSTPADAAPTRDTATEQLIAGGESKLVEFKQTARVNVHTHKRDPVLELMVIKTVAGFMNAEGGSLLIGVTDTGEVSGIAADLKTLGRKQTTDGFALWLNNLLDKTLGPTAASLVRISFESHADETLSRVDVAPGKEPTFVKGGKGEADFYVRLNNATRRLNTSEALNFIRTKWN